MTAFLHDRPISMGFHHSSNSAEKGHGVKQKKLVENGFVLRISILAIRKGLSVMIEFQNFSNAHVG